MQKSGHFYLGLTHFSEMVLVNDFGIDKLLNDEVIEDEEDISSREKTKST